MEEKQYVYACSSHFFDTLKKHELIRETEHQYVIKDNSFKNKDRETRVTKHTEYTSYFKTKEECYQYWMDYAENRIKTAERELNNAIENKLSVENSIQKLKAEEL